MFILVCSVFDNLAIFAFVPRSPSILLRTLHGHWMYYPPCSNPWPLVDLCHNLRALMKNKQVQLIFRPKYPKRLLDEIFRAI